MRDKKLVIVESPAKAKTIGQFLGGEYVVEACFGHVRDLPNKASEIPAEVKKQKWSRLGVNVEADFDPLYIIPTDKKKHVTRLRSALKKAEAVLLATDEDREGESISWHLTQVLSPPKSVPVKRIVFHEITREAIVGALREPRQVDDSLVRAQESRRILDRLYGYTLSPLLWKKVAPKLSAGRVQSVATRLCVLKERQRQAFVSSTYWDLTATLAAENGKFKANLIRVGDSRLATGRSFDATTGELKENRHLLLDEARARSLESEIRSAEPWVVTKLDQTPGTSRPVPPFTTSTLQQEANRKLRFTSKRTMQVAQGLYEGIDLGGERVGLITYMRTDSLTLSERAIADARRVITELYGNEYLPPKAVRYKTASKGAQEAHEAIRPTDLSRRPQDLKGYLEPEQLRLYEMIWKRTIACQMVPARTVRTHVEVTVDELVFSANGKQILFPGFLRAYVEGSDDPEADLGDKEVTLPKLWEGQTLSPVSVCSNSHTTKPPARYTEASLVKKLEEEGIGRPSTYATIISTIQDRNYIFKRAHELVPTFTAFCVTEFLETHFPDLVDVNFTSSMEAHLDEIAGGRRDSLAYLKAFYDGENGELGLLQRVAREQERLDFPKIRVGVDPKTTDPIVVKMGRFGPYLQRGEGGDGNFASVPNDVAPAELTESLASELLERRSAGPDVIAENPETKVKIVLQNGRFGEYLEVVEPETEKDEKAKPRRVSLPRGLSSSDLTPEIAWKLATLPRTVGENPANGKSVTTAIGRFGPFVKCGDEFRSLPDWQAACDISLEEALAILAQPKARRGRGAAKAAPLREFGEIEGADGPVRILDGRFGPYATDGKVNASIPRGRKIEELTESEVLELLKKRAAAVAEKLATKGGRKTTAKKTTSKAKASAARTKKTTSKAKAAETKSGKGSKKSTAKATAPRKRVAASKKGVEDTSKGETTTKKAAPRKKQS